MASPSSDQLTITMIIAGRPYPLRVTKQEEKTVRAMGDEINERYNDFQVRYSDRDKMDCLVMTLLTFADELRNSRSMNDDGTGSEVSQRLAALNDLVEGML